MITLRELNKDDILYIKKLIISEGLNYRNLLNMGWSFDQISNQLHKGVNLSFGAFHNDSLISFIIGDLLDIEKIAEYEILLIYVCKRYRKKGIGKNLLNKISENKKYLKKIYLEVSKNNYEGISFYKKMNFKNSYTRKNYYTIDDKKIDALVMSKKF